MKFRSILLSVLLCSSIAAFAMTDDEVIAYIKQQSAAGKTEQQIGKELLAKGVTPQQAQRIKALYESGQLSDNANGLTSDNTPATRTHTLTQQQSDRNARQNNQRKQNGQQNQANQRGQITSFNQADNFGDNAGDSTFIADVMSSPDLYGDQHYGEGQIHIFGHEIFNGDMPIFAPSENLATPQNYLLGPGDEVIIDIWGNSEDQIRQIISPEGSIIVSQLGPIYLNGMTINDANKHIKEVFAKKYAGVTDAGTNVQMTLGQVRTIQVDIMGEVVTPGTFRMSPFSSVFHSLYNAGGINDIGSLRNIQVLRNGKKVAGVDIYDYLFNGKGASNIRLQDGDVIIVPPYEQLVSISGNVKRPMYYEIKPGETVETIINYAGGFSGDAYSDMVRLSRMNGTENQLYNISKADFNAYQLKDGDLITVGTVLDRYANRVEVEGAVYRPGMFAISNELSTVKQLIEQAEGLTEDAYLQRALLYREGPDLQLQVMAINLDDIMSGKAKDITLKRNDVLVISSIAEITDLGNLTIRGQVAQPGVYPFAENSTVEDLIMRAGGLLDGASTARVNVYRRIVDPEATTSTQQLSQSFTISIENGLTVGENKSLILRPYDEVVIRKSPGYSEQQMVTLDGEVLFTGDYAIQQRNERLSSFVHRAGGLIDGAYVKGAYLTRRLSEAEMKSREEALDLAKSNSGANGGDSIAISKILVADSYSVGIDLEKALAFPGSTYDIVLKDGDRLYVPEEQSTVKIAGDVMFPNSVVYVPGKKLKYYIEQAGGYGQRAKKSKAFVVYMNGSVAIAKGNTPIEPGCQIIVPSKPTTGGTDWTKILALASSFASIATMAATITNIFK